MKISDAFKTPPALMPYFTVGYPDYETSLACIQAAAEAGANLIELGIPFSDPLADGPVIQHSTQVALEHGITPQKCLSAVRELRKRGVQIPLVLMGYINPMFAYGIKRFIGEAAEAGANGFIIPDLPLEEASEVEAACREHDLAYIYMLAPTSTAQRITEVGKRAQGFVYLVSVTGITGERTSLNGELPNFVKRVKAVVRVPLAVGFGISTPSQAHEIGTFAEGVIIGSAVIKAAGESQPIARVRNFIRQMKEGMRL
jgi:tryptophan synthase alpha chain